MFDKIHAARLTALADHLETAKELKVGTFDFTKFISFCRTAGCAVGEASLLWPEHFNNGVMEHFWMYDDYAQRFFGITTGEYLHLFIPNKQMPATYGGVDLYNQATRYDVAANIRAFLEYKSHADDL